MYYKCNYLVCFRASVKKNLINPERSHAPLRLFLFAKVASTINVDIYKEFLRGEPRGINSIILGHQYPLLQYGLGLVTRHDIAEEAVSEAFAQLLRNIGQFANGKHIRNYLYLVVRNKCQAAYSETKRYIPLPEDADIPDPGSMESMEKRESEVYTQLLIRVIYNALEELPQQQRNDFHAYFFESKSLTEIAKERGTYVPTVRRSIQLALKTIKGYLKEKGCL